MAGGIAAVSLVDFLLRLSMMLGLFLDIMVLSEPHRKKTGGGMSGDRSCRSSFEIIPFLSRPL
jgi:hypothetical protein